MVLEESKKIECVIEFMPHCLRKRWELCVVVTFVLTVLTKLWALLSNLIVCCTSGQNESFPLSKLVPREVLQMRNRLQKEALQLIKIICHYLLRTTLPWKPCWQKNLKSIWLWIVSRLACHASSRKMQIFILKLPISHFDLTY